MTLDPVSFVIGLVAGIVLSIIVYSRRGTLQRLWAAAVARLRRLRDQLAASVESRYRAALRTHCDQLNLTQAYADFETLYLDRSFDPPPARPTTTPPDPAAQHPIGLSAVLRAAQRLVVRGESGSGRTTLLIKLARVYSDKQAQVEFGVVSEQTPLLLHLAEIDWATVTEDDPLTALVNAATAHVSRLIASNVSTFLKSHVQSNRAVLLIDGFDEIAPELHPNVIQWLSAVLTKFPDNRIVVTAGPYGYGAFNNLGFAALHLAPWTAKEIDQLARRWVNVISGGKKDIELLSKGLRQIAGVAPAPIDLMLAAIDWRTNTTLPTKTGEAYSHWIDRAIRPPDSKDLSTPDKYKAVLGKIAWSTYQNNRIELTYDEIEQAVISAVSTPVPSAAPTDAAPAAPSAQPARSALTDELTRDIVERTGLLVPFGLNGWAFIHPRVAAYLAAWHGMHAGEALELNWAKPEWAEVFEFYAGLADPGEIVSLLLGASDDLSRSYLWRAAQWTGRAAPEAAWRSRVMGELARTFLQPDQYRHLRDRALNGLLATRDKGLGYLLKLGVTHSDPIVRALALEGLGKIGREAEVPLLA
ncbi:MAG TPA: NACHT domain-containing protein, partial [Anaerolineae bacterium]